MRAIHVARNEKPSIRAPSYSDVVLLVPLHRVPARRSHMCNNVSLLYSHMRRRSQLKRPASPRSPFTRPCVPSPPPPSPSPLPSPSTSKRSRSIFHHCHRICLASAKRQARTWYRAWFMLAGTCPPDVHHKFALAIGDDSHAYVSRDRATCTELPIWKSGSLSIRIQT